MLIDHWPLLGLRLTTPDLELRLPTGEELASLAEVAAAGVHDPGFMPFGVPWTDGTPQQVARSVIQHHWRMAGAWTPDDWHLLFTIFYQGEPIGIQGISAEKFAITRQVGTGSWLGERFQGRGLGTQMRTAVLEFAFTGLGAETAVSSARIGNYASLGVSRKLGYREDGLKRTVVQDQLRVEQRLRVDRRDWRAAFPVHISGLEGCLQEFGL